MTKLSDESISALEAGYSHLGKENERLRAELAEFQTVFDAQWDAQQRAIKRWQTANPGNDLTWPDHADLVVWLLNQLASTEQPSFESRILAVYADLHHKHLNAMRKGDECAREKIFNTIELLREIYPEATAKWDNAK